MNHDSLHPPAVKARGTLFIVGTPIGNLADLSPRARDVLANADVVAAEDTRRTRGLLSHIGVESRLIAYHEHNEQQRVPELIERLAAGAKIALVSDAGMPLISDPGWRLVHAARAAAIDVMAVPGASAVLAALCVTGLPTDRFVFEGFLPRRDAARDERLRVLAREPRTLVLFESVHRVAETLAALESFLGGDRPAAVARELTKVYEQVVVETLATLRGKLGTEIPLLGEFVIVVGGMGGEPTADEDEARRIFDLLSAELEPSKALKLTAAITGLPRNALYRLVRT
jgi:16S rRNA (cytidine1402-2'-O)-methyltransferase